MDDAGSSDMRTGLAGAFQRAADAVSRALTPLRLFAVLPGLLLAAFWVSGETALIVASAILPAAVLVAATVRHGVFPAVVRPPDSQVLSRDDLARWLEAPGPARTAKSTQKAVIALVIDGIPDIQKRFGRSAASAIYDQMVLRLTAILRQDDIMGELGGNAIAFGLRKVRAPETENLLRVARRLQSVCDAPFQTGVSRIYCTVSLGIAAEVHVTNPTPATLIDAAERAGEFAASSGPGSVRIFSEGLFSEKEDERRHARALSSALETGEIFAWFQPQISFKGDRIVGFEALARWDRPEHGVVLPGAFLKDMTRAGLSQRLSEVILKQALTALNAGTSRGSKFRPSR